MSKVSNTGTISVRLDKNLIAYLNKEVKLKGITKTEIVATSIANTMQNGLNVQKYNNGGPIISDSISISTEDMKMLTGLGLGTAAGIAGYQISKYIRNRYDKEPNEAGDMLIALVVGLTTMITTISSKK